MSKQEVKYEGAFTSDTRKIINDNFTELYLDGYALEKIAEVSFGATELSGSEVNTSFSFPAGGAIFLDAWLNVEDNEAGGTVDVGTQGTSNDPDGILDGASVATAGYVGQVAGAVGALRGRFITGGDPVSMTASGDLNSCSGKLYIRYLELPAL